MNKFFSIVVAIGIAFGFGSANAASKSEALITEWGDLVFVESRNDHTALQAIVAVFEKSGYVRQENPYTQKSKDDTWCKVDILTERQVSVECYTPQMGHGIQVSDHIAWMQDEFSGDYSKVPAMVAKIRGEHRRVSDFVLKWKQHKECKGEPCWEEFPKK